MPRTKGRHVGSLRCAPFAKPWPVSSNDTCWCVRTKTAICPTSARSHEVPQRQAPAGGPQESHITTPSQRPGSRVSTNTEPKAAANNPKLVGVPLSRTAESVAASHSRNQNSQSSNCAAAPSNVAARPSEKASAHPSASRKEQPSRRPVEPRRRWPRIRFREPVQNTVSQAARDLSQPPMRVQQGPQARTSVRACKPNSSAATAPLTTRALSWRP